MGNAVGAGRYAPRPCALGDERVNEMTDTTAGRGARASARERILRAGMDLFYERGINAVGVDTVIERAGVAKASLYHHFGSKDELVAAVLRARHDEWAAWFIGAVERRASGAQERILAAFEALEEWFGQEDFRGCAFINASAELAEEWHPARPVCVTHHEEVRAFFEAACREAGWEGWRELAGQLLLLFAGAIVAAAADPGPGPAHAAGRAARALMGAMPQRSGRVEKGSGGGLAHG